MSKLSFIFYYKPQILRIIWCIVFIVLFIIGVISFNLYDGFKEAVLLQLLANIIIFINALFIIVSSINKEYLIFLDESFLFRNKYLSRFIEIKFIEIKEIEEKLNGYIVKTETCSYYINEFEISKKFRIELYNYMNSICDIYKKLT